MSNPANEPGQAAPSPEPSVQAAAAASTKPRSRVNPVVIVCGAVAVLAVLAFALMSRSVATPQASTAPAAVARPVPTARAVVEPIAPSKWSTGPQWVSDRKSVAFELKSSNRVNVWMGQVQPLLVVRCTQDRTEAFVYTETAARIEPGMEDRAVRVRFDDEPYVDERWPDSSEHKGLFAPSGETFTQRLLNAKTLRFQFTPHNAERAEIQFSVAGLRDFIEPVQKKCGWKS